jgi:hypothetical protein
VSDVERRIENDAPGGRVPEAARSQPRVISAGDTFFWKFVVSSLFLVGAAVMVAITLQALARAHELGGIVAAIVVASLSCIGMSMTTIWSVAGLKRVAMSDTSLHVSNFLRDIVVPLNDISSVGEIEGWAYRVCIQFKEETPFGRQIRFSPKGFSSPRPHPIVAELSAAVTNADQ